MAFSEECIVNIRTGKVVASRVRWLESPLAKAVGAMFLSSLDRALVFPFRKERIVSIHMLFVFFHIDCLWLDSNKRVVWMAERVKPFTIRVRPESKAKWLIELPAGSINKTGTKKGDTLTFLTKK